MKEESGKIKLMEQMTKNLIGILQAAFGSKTLLSFVPPKAAFSMSI